MFPHKRWIYHIRAAVIVSFPRANRVRFNVSDGTACNELEAATREDWQPFTRDEPRNLFHHLLFLPYGINAALAKQSKKEKKNWKTGEGLFPELQNTPTGISGAHLCLFSTYIYRGKY